MSKELKGIVNECVEYLENEGIPYSLIDNVIVIDERYYVFDELDNYILFEGIRDKSYKIYSFIPYLFKNIVSENSDRIVEFSKLVKYNPTYKTGNIVEVSNSNTNITLFDNGYKKIDYVGYIYNLTSQYPEWEFNFILKEDEFVFQYGYYHSITPITQEGMGKLDNETLSEVIKHLETNYIVKENE